MRLLALFLAFIIQGSYDGWRTNPQSLRHRHPTPTPTPLQTPTPTPTPSPKPKMAITNLQAAKSSHATATAGVAQTIAFTSNCTINSSIFLFVKISSATALCTLQSDTIGNVYIPWSQANYVAGNAVSVFAFFVPLNKATAANTVSVTCNASVDVELVIYEFSFGAGFMPQADVSNSNSSTSNSTNITTGLAGTTSTSVELAIAYLWCTNTATLGTATWVTTITSGNHLAEYKILAATAAITATGTQNISGRCVGMVCTWSAVAVPTAYWISPTGAVGSGNGSSAGNAADASTAVKHDAIIVAKNQPGQVINYLAGTFLTAGDLPPNTGVSLIGAGITSTILQKASGGADVAMFNTNGAAYVTSFLCSNMTLDFNAINQSWWSGSTGASGGIYLSMAQYCTLSNLKFINMGIRSGEEMFMIVFNDGDTYVGNINHNLVTGCIFTQPQATGNNGGITLINVTDTLPLTTFDASNLVTKCQFLNMNQQSGHSNLNYVQCMGSISATNNTATDIDGLFYVEAGSFASTAVGSSNGHTMTGITLNLSGNTLNNCGYLININSHGSSVPIGNYEANMTVSNNIVNLAIGYEGGTFAAACQFGNGDTSGTPACGGNLTFTGNTINNAANNDTPWFLTATVPFNFTITSITATGNYLVNTPGGWTLASWFNITNATPGVASYTQTNNLLTTIRQVQQEVDTSGSGTTLTLAYPVNPAVQDSLIALIGCSSAAATVSSVTDTLGNVWQLASNITASSRQQWIYYVQQNTSTSADSVSVTLSASGGFMELAIYDFDFGTFVAIVDKTSASSGTATTWTSGATATTTSQNELLMGYGLLSGVPSAGESGWVYNPTLASNAAEYRIVGATGAYTASGTQTSGVYLGAIATFFQVPAGTISLGNTFITAKIGITTPKLFASLRGITQAALGVSTVHTKVASTAALQAHIGISTAKAKVSSTAALQARMGITSVGNTKLITSSLQAKMGITVASFNGGAAIPQQQEKMYLTGSGISRAIIPPNDANPY